MDFTLLLNQLPFTICYSVIKSAHESISNIKPNNLMYSAKSKLPFPVFF